MGGGGPMQPAGKRVLDAEINLVPFIDLLSCCICFLLITAVWTQVAKIDVKPTPNLAAETPPDEPEVRLEIRIGGNGYYLSDGKSRIDLPKVGSAYPVKDLESKLTMLRSAYPDTKAITVRADDTIVYKDLIVVMDACLKVGLDELNVAPAT